MANQFYVGQRVRAKKYTLEIYVTGEGDSPNYPSFAGVAIKGGAGYAIGRYSTTWTKSSFTPIDPPRTVLADWQRNRLENVFDVIDSIGRTAFADVIEQSLNQPEPPKYEPKEGEAVLYESNIWMAGVFTNMVKGKFRIASGNSTFCVDRVIPFDSSLHGSNTND